MDFDISNILYIVITLVAVIVGVLGKKKKPEEGDPGESGSERQPGFMENLERVLQMGQEPVGITELQENEEDLAVEELTPVQAEEKTIGELRGRPSIMDEYDRIMKRNNDGGQDFMFEDGDPGSDALEVIELDDMQGTDYFEIVKDFDAGTAVVYSTIINRLEY